MERRIIVTSDGSHTVEVPEWGVTYHSRHGAIQESNHVFLRAGFDTARASFSNTPIRIFEMGFGSGLNALLTALEAAKLEVAVEYVAIEAFPLTNDVLAALNYGQTPHTAAYFHLLHRAPWSAATAINPWFTLHKVDLPLHDFTSNERFHLIYFDAFAPATQPELWTEATFRQLHTLLHPGGLLTTYCSKGSVRRALAAAGFLVEKLQGPPGKREMVRARAAR